MIKRIVAIATFLTLIGLNPASAIEDRSTYRTMGAREFEALLMRDRAPLPDYDPQTVALELFDVLTMEREGRQSEDLSIEYHRGEEQFGATVLVSVVGLADDSVAGQRIRVDFVSDAKLGWQIVWVGQQHQCWEGRGSQDWTTETCS